jgi:hypothetical protein
MSQILCQRLEKTLNSWFITQVHQLSNIITNEEVNKIKKKQNRKGNFEYLSFLIHKNELFSINMGFNIFSLG